MRSPCCVVLSCPEGGFQGPPGLTKGRPSGTPFMKTEASPTCDSLGWSWRPEPVTFACPGRTGRHSSAGKSRRPGGSTRSSARSGGCGGSDGKGKGLLGRDRHRLGRTGLFPGRPRQPSRGGAGAELVPVRPFLPSCSVLFSMR